MHTYTITAEYSPRQYAHYGVSGEWSSNGDIQHFEDFYGAKDIAEALIAEDNPDLHRVSITRYDPLDEADDSEIVFSRETQRKKLYYAQHA